MRTQPIPPLPIPSLPALVFAFAIGVAGLFGAGAVPASAASADASALSAGSDPLETPALVPLVDQGLLPPRAERLPAEPLVVPMDGSDGTPGIAPGLPGGDLHLIMAQDKDVRQVMVYGYARLVTYNRSLDIVPDILAGVDVDEGRIFTLHLRPGHKWSDGAPFTAEDFRYYWEDVVQDDDLSLAGGAPIEMRVDGKPPVFEVIDPLTVRYTWETPNPHFLPGLAGALPLMIYRPAHYLKQFHKTHADPDRLAATVATTGQRDWIALHYVHDRGYKFDNPDMPTLQPWMPVTERPAERYIFERNPYFHRIDPEGRQLPYLDRVILTIADKGLLPAKTGAGEVDLGARGLAFNNYTFLKRSEERNGYRVTLWRQATGAQHALYPNLNTTDPRWRPLMRSADFRRALSLATNRHEINQVIFYGLGRESNNTALPDSPLFERRFAETWATLDIPKANALLDGLGLTERNADGLRLLPDGTPMELIIETPGEGTEVSDILQLLHDSWLKIGIKVYPRPSSREVLKNRIFSGDTVMSVWKGVENGLVTADTPPEEFCPTHQNQYQWPRWGQYLETRGASGEAVDMDVPERLMALRDRWEVATTTAEKRALWKEILWLNADNQFTIGLIAGVPQPVVVRNGLKNVPEQGIWNWDPGAHFGLYHPDTFWWGPEDLRAPAELSGLHRPQPLASPSDQTAGDREG